MTTELYTAGASYSTVNTARRALSAFLPPLIVGCTMGNRPDVIVGWTMGNRPDVQL